MKSPKWVAEGKEVENWDFLAIFKFSAVQREMKIGMESFGVFYF